MLVTVLQNDWLLPTTKNDPAPMIDRAKEKNDFSSPVIYLLIDRAI